MKHSLFLGILFISFLIIGNPNLKILQASENLPLLLDGPSPHPYEFLSPVGIGDKTIEAAKLSLLREARKVDADAVMEIVCTPGRIQRDGLSWSHSEPYCKGKAIRFVKK